MKERDVKIASQDATIASQQNTITVRDSTIAARDLTIANMDSLKQNFTKAILFSEKLLAAEEEAQTENFKHVANRAMSLEMVKTGGPSSSAASGGL